MLDSRIIDLHVNKAFLKLILGEDVAPTIDNLRVCLIPSELILMLMEPQLVDAELAESMLKLRSIATNNAQSEKVITFLSIFIAYTDCAVDAAQARHGQRRGSGIVLYDSRLRHRASGT